MARTTSAAPAHGFATAQERILVLISPDGREHRRNSQTPPTCSVTAQAKSTTVSAKSETSDSASRGWHCYFPFTMEQWVAAVFHVPESLIQVSLQITVRARCVPLSSAS